MLKASEEFVTGKHGIGYVSDSFKKNLGDTTFEAKTAVPTLQKLPRSMTDAAIENELKPGICDLGDVLAFLDNPQEDTKDGYSNIFYTPNFVVDAYWDGDVWSVFVWPRVDGRCWGVSRRVFSPATAPSNSCTHFTLETRILDLEKFKVNIEKVLKLG